MLEFLRNKRILIVVAHPDDEILGLGATMNKLITKFNVKTRVVILGEGITSRSDVRKPEIWAKELDIHRNNIYNAQKVIGYHEVGIYDFPNQKLRFLGVFDYSDFVSSAATVSSVTTSGSGVLSGRALMFLICLLISLAALSLM